MIERLRFALKFVNHELNLCRANVLAGTDEFLQKYYKVGEVAPQPVHRPSRSPPNPRYSIKRARVANMILFRPARRTHQAIKRNVAI